MRGYTDLSTKPYGTQQNIHVPAVTSFHPYTTMIRHVIQGSVIALQSNVTLFDNTTETEDASVSTARVKLKRNEPAVAGTVHIIIMASAGLLGLAFTACLIVKLVKYRRLQNLQDRTANVLQHQNTAPFHTPAYGYASDSTDAQSGPASAMELSQIVPLIQNIFYHSNADIPAVVPNQIHVQTSTNMELSQLVPPIQNSLYHRDNPATMPDRTRFQNPLPPIQNVSYHSNKSAGLPTQAQEADHTYYYIP
ncbi:Hypp279 [Branchiostoma lanceolatum]|uniref:Hypp279 protein n=1 Tax=Branchiostoma lanceolatum TaxID=7740 RepID=A0A8J9VZ11_BRALA|nr:Hypp279 [Branchiostoma lanceolatum]